ncbi:MAG: hypothetical protein IT438_10585 [Phycisphaerales bacterium]|nr:hypothetical protein [Phycisphaerales bacterium]
MRRSSGPTTPRKPPTPPNPTSALRTENPHLRLVRTTPTADSGARPAISRPSSYKFPGTPAGVAGPAGAWRRLERPERLVAAKVDRAPVERRFTGTDSPCALVPDPDLDDPECAGRIVNSRDLVRQIESTLERMQSRLDDFRSQVDAAFRFPIAPETSDDDGSDRPRAA